MSRTTGTYTLTSNIEPKVGAPLDARTIVKLKSDLTTPGTFAYPYVGLTVFVEEDQKKYTLIDIHYTYIANWREEGSGTTTSADHVTYDNTASQLESTNVQDAIDEIVSNLGTAASKDATDQVTEDSTDLITSGAVYNALENLPSDDTWRSIQVNGNEVQDGTTSSGPLKLVNGTNTNVAFDSTNKTIQVNATDTNTTYSLTQDSSDGHKITLTPSTGTAQTLTIPDNNTTYTLSTGAANGQIKVTPSIGSAYNVDVKGLGSAAYKNSTTSVTEDSADLVTSGAVYTALENLPSEDTKVTQTATTTNANYEILFSETADNTTRTEGAGKAATLRFNPSTGSLMEGSNTVATGSYSHTEGYYTCASGTGSHAEGGYGDDEEYSTLGTFAIGENSHAEGFLTTAYGTDSHAEGRETLANGDYSHAEGRNTIANDIYAHAEGAFTIASGFNSHAEGHMTTASGAYSHAEGRQTSAAIEFSHAEGYKTTASGQYSHAAGYFTCASGKGSHAEGGYTTVGGGSIKGTFATGESAHAEGLYTTASGDRSHAEGLMTIASGSQSHVEGDSTTASDTATHAEGYGTIASYFYAHAEGRQTTASGNSSHAEGSKTKASGDMSHAEGIATTASGLYSHAEGWYTYASGAVSHAEGSSTTAQGPSSHAEGAYTLASGNNAHAEGQATCASGIFSHAEGCANVASGQYSHAEGDGTTASGAQSHAAGLNTCAAGASQTVVGKYNVADTTSLFIVGNGTANNARSNALSVNSDNTTTLGVSGTITSGNSQAVTGGAVYNALQALPEPMVFRGTVGTNGTITTLPVDGTATVGDTYKVITAGTYDSKAAKVGDTFICRTKTATANTWELIPSGDEPSGTVTNVAISNGGGLSVSGSPITTSGTITISHADTSSQATVTNSGRTYIQSVTLDTYGHVTKLTSATETVTNTDRYVNSASFAHDSTNNNVKMTLTRAGSDTATVTGNIPLVSSSTAGVAPKGAAVSSQSQSTKFLREDGTWAAPSYTTDTNTHRPIQVNGTEILGNNTTALNLKAGSNVSLTNSSGTVTIAATDTKYTAGTGLTLDSGAFRTYVPRSNSSSDDSKTIPGVNRFNIREFGNSTLNFPYKEWYHLLTIEGDDSHYATQLALNMTNKAGVYYRKYDNSTWGDWYRLNGALIQKYQTISTTNKWYKLFTISYSQYNYAYLHLLIKAGYENMYEVFLCLRFTPNGIEAASSHAKIIPYNSSSKNVRLYQINDTTFGLAVNAQGATSQIGFELLDMSSEADALNAWSLTIANPFTELEAGPTAFGNHRYFTGNYADINGTPSLNYLPLAGGSLTGGLEIKGIIAGDTGSTGHGLWGGGGYHNAYNNIILHGDNQTGTSGIAFVSDKSNGTTITNINQPSDRAFIQYHAYGITTATAESTNPTLATTGEAGRFVVGVGNDSTDQLWLQTPAKTGLIHQVGATSYVIPDTNNTTGTVGSVTQPVYVNAGSITATTYSLAKSVPADADFTNTHRPIQVNGTEILGNNTTALNLKAGNNISLSNSSGTVTIAATDTNTTYTIATGDSNGQIKVTPSSGSAYNVSVKGLGSNAYTSTAYLPLAGGTLTDNVALKRSTIDAQASNNGLSSGTEYPTTFNILDKNNLIMVRNEGIISSDGNISGYWYVRNYNGSTTQVAQKGIKMTMNKSGTLTYTVDDAANFRSAISAAASSHTHTISQVTWPGNQNLSASATANSQEWSIDLNAGSYTGTYFHIYSGRNSKSILQCFTDSNEVIVPSGNLKVTGGKTYNRVLADMLTGTGTAAQDKGSGVSPRYFPAKWTFNIGIATPADGDIVTIKVPVAGHDFGTFLSLDNGTTYRPISVDYGTGRLTTHYAVNRPITLIYDASGGTNSVYAAAGADARSNITGGCWRVMNFWDSGNTYDRNRYNAAIKAWGTKIIAGNIIVGINGLYHHLKEGTAFDITYPILYLNGDCNASATTTNTYDIIHFTSTTTQNTSWTAYKPVYIKGSLSGNTFTPISTTPLLQTVPTSEDNYYYMLLGIATATNTIYLQERHPIFAYRYNQFAEITWNSQFASFLKPVAANTSTAFSNWNIPSGSYQVWGQQFRDNRLTYTPSGGSATTITDTGDWTIWLTGNATANAATLNMRIDGTYYGSFSGNLSGNATSANTSDLARRLQWTTVRMTTPNTHWNDAALRYYLSSSAMTTDKPRNLDGKIIHMPWDNDGGYASQMFIAHGQYALAALRCQNGNKDAWGSWMPMGVFSQTTPTSGQVIITDGTNGMIKSSGYTIATSVPSGAVFTDTKNTTGSTDTSSKIFLIGATSQAANPQTYSDNEVYATSGVLTTKSVQVGGTAATMQYNATNHCIDFIVT